MLELKLGKMTTQELADWAGKSVKYLSDHKKKWCQANLDKYAVYELTHGGVIIKEIKTPVFITSGLQEVRERYRQYWGYNNLPIDTNTKCWRKLSLDMVNKVTYETGRRYVGQCRREDYGVARKTNKYTGSKGECHYIFCKSIDEQPVLFTEEELKIKAELWKKHMTNIDEADAIERQALTKSYQKGEIDANEYAEAMAYINTHDRNWITFQIELEEALGCQTDFYIEIIDDAIKHKDLELKNDKHFEF